MADEAGGATLLVSSGDHIYWAALNPEQPGQLEFDEVPFPGKTKIDDVSGMAFGPGATLYVGGCSTNTGWTLAGCTPQGGPTSATAWPQALPDDPEFLLYVPI